MNRNSKSFEEIKTILGYIGVTVTEGLPKDKGFSIISRNNEGGFILKDSVRMKEFGETQCGLVSMKEKKKLLLDSE